MTAPRRPPQDPGLGPRDACAAVGTRRVRGVPPAEPEALVHQEAERELQAREQEEVEAVD